MTPRGIARITWSAVTVFDLPSAENVAVAVPLVFRFSAVKAQPNLMRDAPR